MRASQGRPRRARPSRAEIDPAALRLIARYGPQVLATARRYSLDAADAEDAYQRGLEILLTKAPTTREEELVPWLKTVVKHEAFAIRRQRERAAPVADDDARLERAADGACVDERAERLERLRVGAEALERLKPQEVRCLLLRAEGYSYRQICEITGWTYTKVNRCLTEGRASFLARVDGIRSGAECERLASQLSALADGEATAEDMAALRPHLRGCLACRATLREYRAAPARVAALLPPAALAVSEPGGLARWLESLAGALSERASALAGGASERAAHLVVKAQGAAEIVSAQKVAAVAASTAMLAGGGVATVKTLEPREPPPREDAPAPVEQQRSASSRPPAAHPLPQPVPAAPATTPRPGRAEPGRATARKRRRRSAEPERRAEFEPDATTAPTPRPAPAPPTSGGPGGSDGGSTGSGGTPGDFGSGGSSGSGSSGSGSAEFEL